MRAEKDQTCSQTIRKRRYSTEIKEGYIRLFWRIVLIVAVGWLLFTQVFLIGQAPDNEMSGLFRLREAFLCHPL